MLIWVIVILVVAGLVFVRFAPTDPARWHVPVAAQADKDMEGGAIRVLEGGPDDLRALQDIALGTPRTHQIAGSVEEGRLTFETRSKWIGFPDYTTIEQSDGQIKMFARLRFGRSDLGVNAKRLEAWIDALKG